MKTEPKKTQKTRQAGLLFWGLLIAYTLGLLWLLLLQRVGTHMSFEYLSWVQMRINLVPGRTIYNYIKAAWRIWSQTGGTYMIWNAAYNIVGNIVVFVPLGYFLPALWMRQRTFGCFVTTVTLGVLVIEALQLITMLGAFDLDDLFLNVVGASVGFVCWHRYLKRRKPRAAQVRRPSFRKTLL